MSTPICVIGTIATHPRFTRTASGVAFCSFRVASNERRYDREQAQWVDGDTNWFTVNAFRGLAEHASDSFAKGDRVVVYGRVRVRRWETDQKSGTAVEVEAEAFGHDLRWGVSRFTKRSGAAPGSESTTSAQAPSPSTAAQAQEQAQEQLAVPDGAHGEGDGFVPVAA